MGLEPSDREGGLGNEVSQTWRPGPVGPCTHGEDRGAPGSFGAGVRHDPMWALAESFWLWWRPDCRGKVEMGSGKEAGGPACSGVRCSRIPDVGGRSISYFKKCAFGFHFCLLFKASASGVLLMGVMECFEYDYFNKKASLLRQND